MTLHYPSAPVERAELLEHIMQGLKSEGYPINRRVYNSYLTALHCMRIAPDLNKVRKYWGPTPLPPWQGNRGTTISPTQHEHLNKETFRDGDSTHLT